MAVFAGDAFEILDLQVFNQDAAQAVGVGQLIASCIDLEEVGVALVVLVAEGIFAGTKTKVFRVGAIGIGL